VSISEIENICNCKETFSGGASDGTLVAFGSSAATATDGRTPLA